MSNWGRKRKSFGLGTKAIRRTQLMSEQDCYKKFRQLLIKRTENGSN